MKKSIKEESPLEKSIVYKVLYKKIETLIANVKIELYNRKTNKL